ncbi:MAG: hypothetical protein ACRC6T_12025 [Sarcina sp.]
MIKKEYISMLRFNIKNILDFKTLVMLFLLVFSINIFKKHLYESLDINYVAGVAGLIKEDIVYKIISYYSVIILLMYINNFNQYFIGNISHFMIKMKNILVIKLGFISNICINVFIITLLNIIFSIIVFGKQGNYLIENSLIIKNNFMIFINFIILTYLTFVNICLFNNYLVFKYKNIKNAVFLTFLIFVITLEFSLLDSPVLKTLSFFGTGNFINFANFSYIEIVSLYIYILLVFIGLIYINFKTINRHEIEDFIIKKETIYD